MSNIKYKRPTWDEYFVYVTKAISTRATCSRGRSGCVIVKDNYILTTGYVGAPSGLLSCDEAGHILQNTVELDGSTQEHCIRTVHAEQNAICNAAKRGVALNGAELYCTMTPCRVCAMLLIQCGIKKVHCLVHYPHKILEENTQTLFKSAGIEINYFSSEESIYD